MIIPAIYQGGMQTKPWKLAHDSDHYKHFFMAPLQSADRSTQEEYAPEVILVLLPSENPTHDSKQFIEACEREFLYETMIKPWGSYTILQEGGGFKVKCLVVKPGASLSLQSHDKRAEYWIVFRGEAQVINGDREFLLKRNESTFIPQKTRHRLTNAAHDDLIIIEIQTGVYLGEDDIIRYSDLYSRV